MSCPDLSALARAGGPHADPAVVEHLRTCASCRLDWQIQQGTRYLLDPEIMTRAFGDLDDRIIARATAIMRQSERLPGWGHLARSGLLVALAAVAVTWAPVNAGVTLSVTQVGLYALVGAVATVLYLRRIDEAECGGGHHPHE
ncbi:MAG: hypothetical protein OXU69_06185 [Gemmatimonadota bacterium]|nr:hypothetical protein [Gemmatimonadota bacterium]MDE2984275.1 hypothetical protein [Gemmatimonadota bacterium]